MKQTQATSECPRREQVFLYRKPIMVHTKGSGFMWVPRRWDCASLLTRSMSTMSGTGVSTTKIQGAAIEGEPMVATRQKTS